MVPVVDGAGWSQRAGPAYVTVIEILWDQYIVIGFDASAHMTKRITTRLYCIWTNFHRGKQYLRGSRLDIYLWVCFLDSRLRDDG